MDDPLYVGKQARQIKGGDHKDVEERLALEEPLQVLVNGDPLLSRCAPRGVTPSL